MLKKVRLRIQGDLMHISLDHRRRDMCDLFQERNSQVRGSNIKITWDARRKRVREKRRRHGIRPTSQRHGMKGFE